MKRYTFIISILLVCLSIISRTNIHAQTPPIVRAVLFYLPTCDHCRYVITETLPPLIEKYGEQLQIFDVDVSRPAGQILFSAALKELNVKGSAVPFLVIDNRYLIGSSDIPEQFPGLIETYLAQGGVDWPDIPGLSSALATAKETKTPPSPTQSTTLQLTPVPAVTSSSVIVLAGSPKITSTDHPTTAWRENLAHDPTGSGLAILILLGMLAAIVWVITLLKNTKEVPLSDRWSLCIPILCIFGLGVAGYLAYVEAVHITAACGPVGDCNTVQQSGYARLFGILPMGMLGLVGYAIILLAWLVIRFTFGRPADLAALSLFMISFLGTLFSVYLTFLEPFVIGATCAWCLTSAILITMLMLLSIRPAKLALGRFR